MLKTTLLSNRMEAKYNIVDNNKKSRRYFYRQMSVSLAVLLSNFTFGLSMGGPTVIVPQLRKQANSTSAVSEEMASWITTIVPASGLCWVLVLVMATHYKGRKKPAAFIGLASLIAFTMLFFSSNVMHVFCSQAIQGISTASVMTISVVILIEFTMSKYHGMFVSFKTASYYWGIWAANAIGTFCHYKYIGVLGLVLTLYILFVFSTMPESPYWLATQKRYEESADSHRWLMGTGEEAEKELLILITTQRQLNETPKPKKSWKNKVTYNFGILRQPEIKKPVLLCGGIVLTFYFSGKLVCTVYAIEVLKKMFDSESATYMTMLIVDGFTVATLYASAILTKFIKRRLQFFGISFICAMLLFILALYMYLVKLCIISENIYLTITILIAYTISVCAGPLASCSCLYAELLPKKHRTFIVTIFCLYSKSLIAIFLKMGPFLLKKLEIHGVFLFFGICLVLCLLSLFKYLPETKDKTAQELSEMFKVKTRSESVELFKNMLVAEEQLQARSSSVNQITQLRNEL